MLNSIPRRLKGRAYEAYAGIAPNYERLDDFLQDLKLSFGGITDANTIKLDMRQAEQNPCETVADYALRVQNLEQALHAIYDSSVSLTANEKEQWKKRTSVKLVLNFVRVKRNQQLVRLDFVRLVSYLIL